MADICDKASESDGVAVENALRKIRALNGFEAAKRRRSSLCLNECGDRCIDRFCSPECRDDFEQREKQKERFKT